MPLGLPLDFDTLLARLPGDAPAGSSSVFFEIRPKLEELRREFNPADIPGTEDPAKSADWVGIEKLTRDTLSTTAKDLRVAGYLIEALVKRYRFDGLAAGLELIRRLFETCWEYLLPVVEDGDLGSRAMPVENMLDAPDKGLRLPTAVRMVPILRDSAGAWSFLDWLRSQDQKDKDHAALAEALNKAIAGTKPEAITAEAVALDACLEGLGLLTKTMDEKLGGEAPTLQRLREALEDCRRLVGFVLQKTGPARPAGEANPNTTTNDAGTTGSSVTTPGRGASREALYQQLDVLAQELQSLEPHSPIPYLIRRAVKLGALTFPDLIRALVRDANVLNELTREFALPENKDAG